MPPFNKPSLRKPQKNFPFRRRPTKQPSSNFFFWLVLSILFVLVLSQSDSTTKLLSPQDMPLGDFYALLKDNNVTQKIQKVELLEGQENYLQGKLSDGKEFHLMIAGKDENLLELLRANVKDYSVKPAQSSWVQFLLGILPYVLLILFIWFISYRGNQMGNKIWSFGKTRAKISTNSPVTFNDVAGVDEAKEELQEIIEFLKEPKKFQRLGGKIPRGVLLVGHPGTGKTLLAKAVAGEAEVPFFSLSGSDFVEMFVGVGASRVRDLFDQARKASLTSGKGAIVFIDEIDAVGRQRFSGIGGGNDEREQTLNALLVELDGFTPQTGVIVMAATNRPDTLDPALLRPGRFDRQIVVTLPDIQGREGILKVHSKNLKISTEVNFTKLAQQTVYFSGADLANVCNEAALLAARKNKEQVEMSDFLAAIERVTMGPEKKSRTISKKEKAITAYHEAGHALLSLLIEEVDTFTKISIIPRGMAGGYTLTPPTEDKHYRTKKELLGSMSVLLGGMIGEELFTGDTSTGVSNDLQRVTEIARAMVREYGMSERIGRMGFGDNQQYHFLGRDLMDNKNYSDATAHEIDLEIKNFVDQAYQRSRQLLTDHQENLKKIAEYLIEKEIIDIDTARELLGLPKLVSDTENSSLSGPSPNPNPTT